MALWLTRSGRHGEHEPKFLEDCRIYLTWGRFNHDLSKVKDRATLLEILEETYPNQKRQHHIQNRGQIWIFSHRMKPGDWVVVPSKRKTVHIGEITGDYTHDPKGENPYYHYRTVKWLETDIPRTNFDQDILNSLGAFTTICQIKRNDIENRVRAMQGNGWKSVGIAPLPGGGGGGGNGRDDPDPVEEDFDIEQIARDQIARLIYSKYSGHGLEILVEAILKAQGFTTHHSPKGADGGIDILASPDTLGFGNPRICVQVKSQDSPLERPVLDQLVGTMQNVGADQGLLVCWGGFKPTIKREMPRLFFKVRMWDQNDLIDQFLANYDRLDEDLQAEIPLKRIWAVASQDEGEQD
ncbi:MAG: restriction endonuclease [Planctomycetes bacterium]|nr:restriction endonuclease [Planctomycetota bacterium]NOG53327.1 restriction endonuclease [Planctomycetota bacterium]